MNDGGDRRTVLIEDGLTDLDEFRGSTSRLREADLVIGLEGNRAHILKDRYGQPRTVPRYAVETLAKDAKRV